MIILYQLDIAKDQKIDVSIDDTIKANVEVENEFVKQVVYGCVTYKDKITIIFSLNKLLFIAINTPFSHTINYIIIFNTIKG